MPLPVSILSLAKQTNNKLNRSRIFHAHFWSKTGNEVLQSTFPWIVDDIKM